MPNGRQWSSGCQLGLGVVGCPTLAQWDLPKDFRSHTNASSPRDFWAMRQEKTLTLSQELQAYTKGLGAPTGILCDSAWELQTCMAPLMTLSGDDIVKASLLKPTEEECGTTPTLEEEAILLGEEVELQEVPGSLPKWLEIPQFVEPAIWANAPSTSPPPFSTS